jgi:hypothetical protein
MKYFLILSILVHYNPIVSEDKQHSATKTELIKYKRSGLESKEACVEALKGIGTSFAEELKAKVKSKEAESFKIRGNCYKDYNSDRKV